MSAPEVARTLELIDQTSSLQPLRLRPGQAVAARMWTQEFRGEAVNPQALAVLTPPEDAIGGLIRRNVRTAEGR